MSSTEPSATLWDFAVRIYGCDGVAAACLALQERHDIDVPLLLFAAWTASNGMALSPAHAAEASASVADWHREVVQALRTVRQRLKTGPAPAPSPATEVLRATVKRAELESEKLQLASLEQQSARWHDRSGSATADANLATMFTTSTGAIADAEAFAHLSAIARASQSITEIS